MKLASFALVSALLVAAPVGAQDPLKVAPKVYHLVAENDRVRVLHVALPPGGQVAMHSHPAHLAVIMTSGMLKMTADGKTTDIPGKADEAMLMPAGSHAMANPGKETVEVIVVEMKGAPGKATIPTSRPGMKMTKLVGDARVEVYRVTAAPSFKEPAGTTHDYDQVVIPVAAADINVTIDGKTITGWKRGEARLIGRGVAHESKGGTSPAELIIVAVK
jgi:quercetin dioxygenase-like cupin family protein